MAEVVLKHLVGSHDSGMLPNVAAFGPSKVIWPIFVFKGAVCFGWLQQALVLRAGQQRLQVCVLRLVVRSVVVQERIQRRDVLRQADLI